MFTGNHLSTSNLNLISGKQRIPSWISTQILYLRVPGETLLKDNQGDATGP